MSTVTNRVGQIKKQSRFLKLKDFEQVYFEDGLSLSDDVSVSAPLIGTVVESLSEFLLGQDKNEVFKEAAYGFYLFTKTRKENNDEVLGSIEEILSNIKGLDKESIQYACLLSNYELYFRSSYYVPVTIENIDDETIKNIEILVNRTVKYFSDNTTFVTSGVTFEGAYNDVIKKGDMDILTEDGLWDIKVKKSHIQTKDSLQLLTYYVLGLHSDKKDMFTRLNKIGVFNPKLNLAYTINVSDIPQETISNVEKEVIGY